MNKSYLHGLVCVFSVLSTQYVYGNSVPIADAGPDQYILTDTTTRLQGSAVDPNGEPIISYEWNLDASPAGSSSIIQYPDEPDPRFFADTAGQYDLSLRASDGIDWSNPDTVSVFLADLLTPQAVIDAIPTSGVAPLTVQFDGSNSFTRLFDGTDIISGTGSAWDDGSLSTLFYDWNFGDGSAPSPDAAPSHTFALPGTYTVTLGLLDSFSQFDEMTIEITVNAVPVPPAVWLFGTGLVGLIGVARRKKS